MHERRQSACFVSAQVTVLPSSRATPHAADCLHDFDFSRRNVANAQHACRYR